MLYWYKYKTMISKYGSAERQWPSTTVKEGGGKLEMNQEHRMNLNEKGRTLGVKRRGMTARKEKLNMQAKMRTILYDIYHIHQFYIIEGDSDLLPRYYREGTKPDIL